MIRLNSQLTRRAFNSTRFEQRAGPPRAPAGDSQAIQPGSPWR